ncbi:hypothetical protein [Robertkochia aurantiaca]|uniref:hypothetical protein n=1 Tax=Robertkochia aurantiaca TaxID=2873700 RepID=UPI001CCC1EF8|nr:hypothetical protein [Robertkochia sp. 3YJGBD-33]
MASIRDLKKDINFVLGDIIEAVYLWEVNNDKKNSEKGDQIIDETIETFDELIAKVNKKDVENRKQHLREVSQELETRAVALVEKVNAL